MCQNAEFALASYTHLLLAFMRGNYTLQQWNMNTKEIKRVHIKQQMSGGLDSMAYERLEWCISAITEYNFHEPF